MQTNKLYVGNINYNTTSQELEDLFSSYGQVVSVKLIEGKGFGFVEMSGPEEAAEAKEKLDGSEFQGRNLRVDEARPQTNSRGGSGGGGGGPKRGGRGNFGGGRRY